MNRGAFNGRRVFCLGFNGTFRALGGVWVDTYKGTVEERVLQCKAKQSQVVFSSVEKNVL